MNYKEFEELLHKLGNVTIELENAYIEGEGEVTEETEKLEDVKADLKELLTTEGVDFLGRWLKAKEDKKKALKAEKDFIDRQMKALDRSKDFIMALIEESLRLSGENAVKGEHGYSFTRSKSTKTTVDNALLDTIFGGKVRDAVKDILPPDVELSLSAKSSLVPEGELLPEYYVRTTEDTVTFRKPKATKE